jgi:hypothetical protein
MGFLELQTVNLADYNLCYFGRRGRSYALGAKNSCGVIHNCHPPYMRYNGVSHSSMSLSPISSHSLSLLTQTRAYGAVFSVIQGYE